MLQNELELIPVCPEIEAGLDIPRPTIHIRRIEGEMRLTHSKDGSMAVSDAIRSVADRRAESLGPLSGFILKRKSPSCGMERVRVSRADGQPRDRTGMGLFAKRFAELRPLVPLEEKDRSIDSILREIFLERVYALHRWYQLVEDDVAGFIRFHASHKLILMTGGSSYHGRLGRIVAGVARHDLARRRQHYIREFMSVLARRTSRKRHINLLQHAMGYLKRDLDGDDKRELLAVLDDYRTSLPGPPGGAAGLDVPPLA